MVFNSTTCAWAVVVRGVCGGVWVVVWWCGDGRVRGPKANSFVEEIRYLAMTLVTLVGGEVDVGWDVGFLFPCIYKLCLLLLIR